MRMALFLALAWLAPAVALAQTCTATIGDMVFDGPDVLSGGHVDTMATLNISCSGLVGLMQVCPSIDAGTGGASGASHRRMQRIGGTETLNFQLYRDSGRSLPWGSLQDPSLGDPPGIGVILVLFLGGEAAAPVYGRIFGGQSSAPPGNYRSDLNVSLRYGPVSILTGCNSPLLTYSTPGPSFAARTSIQKQCLMSVTEDVDFGAASILGADVDAAGALSARCTADTPYSIRLGAGLGPGASVGARRMTGPGGAIIDYSLFRDPGRSQNWGQTDGADTFSGTGTGNSVAIPVYGRVPPQPTPGAGLYSDTVVVTLDY